MKIEKTHTEENFASFISKDVTNTFLNAVRRFIMTEIPTLAADDLEIVQNTSPLYDEMIALRLGLMPIKTDLKSYEYKEKCKCGGAGCAKCQLKLFLKSNKEGWVYADKVKSQDPKCTFCYEKTPIVKLMQGQEIEIAMTATVGKGKNHTKWSPGRVWFTNIPNIKLNGDIECECVKNKKLDEDYLLKGNPIEACLEKIEANGNVDFNTNRIVFFIEAWGQLTPEEMLMTSLDEMKEQLNDFSALLK